MKHDNISYRYTFYVTFIFLLQLKNTYKLYGFCIKKLTSRQCGFCEHCLTRTKFSVGAMLNAMKLWRTYQCNMQCIMQHASIRILCTCYYVADSFTTGPTLHWNIIELVGEVVWSGSILFHNVNRKKFNFYRNFPISLLISVGVIWLQVIQHSSLPFCGFVCVAFWFNFAEKRNLFSCVALKSSCNCGTAHINCSKSTWLIDRRKVWNVITHTYRV